MAELVRFSISLEEDLLAEFDHYCEVERLATRSEAIRQLLREKLTNAAWDADDTMIAASLTLVYDHHRTKLMDKMLDLQHAHSDWVVATMHVHLTHDLCMETIALRGPAGKLRTLASELGGLKGIRQASLVIANAETESTHSHVNVLDSKPRLN